VNLSGEAADDDVTNAVSVQDADDRSASSSRIGANSVGPCLLSAAMGRQLIRREMLLSQCHRRFVCVGRRETHAHLKAYRAENSTECVNGGGAPTRLVCRHRWLARARPVSESLLSQTGLTARHPGQMP
jgi:hypothetical protein